MLLKILITFFTILTLSSFSLSDTTKHHKDLVDIPHEVDGKHKSDFDHEAMLGKEEAKRFDDMTPEESKKALGQLHDRIDTNGDGNIDSNELAAWISHLSKSTLQNDVDRMWGEYNFGENDKLTWEKHRKELFDEDYDIDDDDESHKTILEKDERRWKIADLDKDGKLSKSEYLAFAHPEQDPMMRDVIIQETIEELDKDKDGFVSLEEYINDIWIPEKPGDVQPEWVQTEREMFSLRRDKNGDGKLDHEEIGDWISPKDMDLVQREVKHLFSESDENGDGLLTKEEVLNHHNLFVGSQATDFGDMLSKHDEL